METRNNGSGNPWGPDQNHNPHTGNNKYQWEESGTSDESSATKPGSANSGNTTRMDLRSDEIDADRQDNDDFTTNDLDQENTEEQ